MVKTTKTKEQKDSKNTPTLKVQAQETNLTDLKELLKKSKLKKKEKTSKKGLILGIIIAFIGILALIATLLINHYVDREYFSDITIIFTIGVSLFALLLGFYIIIKEIK